MEIFSSASALGLGLGSGKGCTGRPGARVDLGAGALRASEAGDCLETVLVGWGGGSLLGAVIGVLVSMISSDTVAMGGCRSQDADV